MAPGWHSRFGGIEWSVTSAGVHLHADGIQRTPGEPVSMRLYLALLGPAMQDAVNATSVPIQLLLMTVATESGAARVAGQQLQYARVRMEPGYLSDEQTPQRISVGPCHILLSTARAVLSAPKLRQVDLLNPATNILAAARFIRDRRAITEYDPILVAASYNAGSLRETAHNRWHLYTTGDHLDRAARWYGDACAVVAEFGAYTKRGGGVMSGSG